MAEKKTTTTKSAKTAPEVPEVKAAPEAKAGKNIVGKYKVDSVYGEFFQFSLYANNGQLLYESREYATKKSCLDGVETFKKNLQDPSTTVRVDKDKNGRFKYIIKNRNSIYVGETYEKSASAESAADSVKRFAPVSKVVD